MAKSVNRRIIIGISLALIFFSRFLPAPAGLSASGVQVLGIFAGVLLLWLTVAIDWPSLLCMLALATVPELSMGAILSGSIGNTTFSFLMFTFMCTYALSQTPFIRRCALSFIKHPLSQKGPWQFTILFFASIIFLGSFISPTVLFVIYLPIIEEIYAVLGLKKGSKPASMLMMGLVFCCGISSGMTPIAHVFPLMAMEYYQTATGLQIAQGAYMAFAVPVGILAVTCMLLMFRFLLRPNMSEISAGDVAKLSTVSAMDAREKATIAIFSGVVALWIVPGMLQGAAPSVYDYFNALGTAFPPLLGAVALSVISLSSKSLLNFKEAMEKGIPWGSLIMCAGTLAIGSAMTNKSIGITEFLSGAIAPVASTMAPMALIFLFAIWAALQTNFSSNMVTVTVVTAIAIPICTVGGVNVAAMCAIIGLLASYAFATPPAMPCVAIAGASGWTSAGSLVQYGFVLAAVSVVLCAFIGYPLAAVLM